ncbi:DUF1211 domain-containing protein [Lactococcus lactis subsp. lactis]|nr:DUF1211 domain-containing protein [Lactococcus lactis subsp. lactis]
MGLLFVYLWSFLMTWSVWFNHHALFKDTKTINVIINWWIDFKFFL